MPFRFCHPRLLPVPAKPACVDGRLRQLEDACGQRVVGARPPGPSRTRAVVFPATTWPSAARRRHFFSAAPSAVDVERRPPRPRRSLHLVDVRSPELLKCLEFGSDCVVFTCLEENQKQVDYEASEKQHKDVEVAQHDIISRWSSDVLQPFDTAYRAFVRSREAKPNNLHRPEILVTEEMRNLAERGLVDGVARLEKKTAEKGCGPAEKDSTGGPFLLAQRTFFLRIEENNVEDERRLVLVASPATSFTRSVAVLLKSGRSVTTTQKTIPLSELQSEVCVAIVPDPEVGGAAALCASRTICRVCCNEFEEVMRADLRDELRFVAACRKIVQDVALSPMASNPLFRIWIVSEISNNARDSGTFRDLWRLLAVLPALQLYVAAQLPPAFCLKIDVDVPLIAFHIHYVELALRDAGVKWPKRSLSVRFNLKDREESMRRGESQRWVASYYPIPVDEAQAPASTKSGAAGNHKPEGKTRKRPGKPTQETQKKTTKRKKPTEDEQELLAGEADPPSQTVGNEQGPIPSAAGCETRESPEEDPMILSQDSMGLGLSSQF
eukprot:g9852.t1